MQLRTASARSPKPRSDVKRDQDGLLISRRLLGYPIMGDPGRPPQQAPLSDHSLSPISRKQQTGCAECLLLYFADTGTTVKLYVTSIVNGFPLDTD
jgi:hypothetical protein